MNAEISPRALIVEDEALLALAMEDLLTAEGFQVISVSTAAEVEQLALGELAVAIVNLCLAGELAGQRVIVMLRNRIPRLPVVVVTGYSANTPEANLRGVGWPTTRLHKPEHYEQLTAAVWAVIEQAGLGMKPLAQERRQGHGRSSVPR